MAGVPATRVLQAAGILLFAIGAILMAVGTTSIPLFVLYAALTFGGAIVYLVGKKLSERTLR